MQVSFEKHMNTETIFLENKTLGNSKNRMEIL